MGIWGTGSFESDQALDWIADIEHQPTLDLVCQPLRVLLSGTSVADEDKPWEQEDRELLAVAAAEVIAAVGGFAGKDLPLPAGVLAEMQKWKLSGEIYELALHAIAAVAREESALAELWEGKWTPEIWNRKLEDLARRLSSANEKRKSQIPVGLPAGVVPSTTTQLLRQRYEQYQLGSEPLLSMAYYCLTVVEAQAGGRKQAAGQYKIEEDVLRKIGELSSTRGDQVVARKHRRGLQPLSRREQDWLETTIRNMINHLAWIDSGRSHMWLRMDHLPSLEVAT